jgi:hypothetical protein
MRFTNCICLIIVSVIAGAAQAEIATFDELILSPETYWNGSDGSGGFTSSSAFFSNNFTDWGGGVTSWESFSYSNITDTTTQGLPGQYNAVIGEGQGGSPNYAICFVGWTEIPTLTLDTTGTVYGSYVTNNNTTYYSLLNSSAPAKKFGGISGNDPDWLLLTITGKDVDGVITGIVDFYLADYRFDDNSMDYIIDTWEYIDLTSLGQVKTLEFALSSSDIGDWGMNTPAYFALDTIIFQPESADTASYNDDGVNGYINPYNNWKHAAPQDPNAVINPIFRDWATEVLSYNQTPGVDSRWSDPNKTLGPATGNVNDIFSLGDLSREQIAQGESVGWIILTFDEPIQNNRGYDFAVFENGLLSDFTTQEGSTAGELLAELAYVEVSSNGIDFVRFPSLSLTEQQGDLFSTIDMKNVYNLAGKHPNAYNVCTGTPFDLQEISNHSMVTSGLVDINDIKYIRLVDIPGTGDFYDDAVAYIDPNTWPAWDYYSDNHPVFDAWNTSLVPLYPSGGFDLEAIGILEEQEYSADINLDGIVDESDLDLFLSAWQSHLGQEKWIARCDLAEPKNYMIDHEDMDVFLLQWLKVEKWRY